MAKLISNNAVYFFYFYFSLLLAGCAGSAGSSASSSSIGECSSLGTSSVSCPASAVNVIPITVGGTLTNSYQNEPVVSVTICKPGTATCVTVDNILLDTGSYGLRVFSSVISSLSLSTVQHAGKDLAECVMFGTGSMWGPVKAADVYLGGEPVLSSISIQSVDTSYFSSAIPNTTPDCSDSDTDPNTAGYNGIMGVGGTQYDAAWGYYFSCAAGTCSTTAIGNASPALQNPVYALTATASSDGNGMSLILPALSASGVTTASGCMVLGIGTRANNVPGTLTILPAASDWSFRTTYNGHNYTDAFIDSGSNAYGLPNTNSSLPLCSGGLSDFYCPSSTQCLSAIQKGTAGSPSVTVNFAVANTRSLLNTGNQDFKNIAFDSSTVDWGLPFYFGRIVYVGNSGQNSTINSAIQTGPFWAF